MRKTVSLILAAVFMAAAMTGCSSQTGTSAKTTEVQTVTQTEKKTAAAKEANVESKSEPLKVGLSFVSLNFPYYVRMYEQFMEEAEKNGWDVTFVDGNLDAVTQMNGIQDMVNNDVDIMVVSTWFIDAMEDVFAQCKEKDIPVFIIGNTQNPDAINNLIVYACGTEHYDAGFLGGTWAAGHFSGIGKNSIKMAIMTGSTEQMKQRAQGFVDGMKKGGIEVEVLNEYDVSAREDAMASGEDALTAYSDLDLIYGVSAQGSLGAYDATVGANRTEVSVIGYDGEDEELELIKKGTNYIATITQDPAGEASTTAAYIKKYLNGESFEQIVPISAGVYCAEGQLTSDQVLGK